MIPVAPETNLLVAILVPLACAVVIPFFGRTPNLREAVTLVTAIVLCLSVFSVVQPVLEGARPERIIFEVAPGLALAFQAEPLGVLFALIASILWAANSVYAIGYMRGNNEPRQTAFFSCLAIAIGSAMGIAFAENLFTFFLFYEALTISTYPLVTHHRNAEAMKSGRLYLLLLIGTSMGLFLPAIIATWVIGGTLAFTQGGILAGTAEPLIITILLVLYAFGIGKAAIMPIHFWLPAAMVAPTPVSAFLHAVAVVKAGVFAVLKVVVYVFGLETLIDADVSNWFTILAGITILTASLIALQQDNLKRRLAYSTISQLSYVVLGAAILTPLSIIGAAMHIAAHAFGKITLFFAAGSLYTGAHLTKVSELDGIGRRMPWTMGAFAVGSLSMLGLPLTAGFLGKWFILGGAMESSNWIAVAVILLSTALNAGYFLPIIYRAFFRPLPDHASTRQAHDGSPWQIVFALTATAVGTIIVFFFPNVFYALSTQLVGP
jgi:multicomponent Na+:H+ antiporter subunit D